jgi:ATP-dependent Clp protease ATP-binding subunit ClpA
MFERFTEEARRTVVFAKEEAYTLQHTSIGTQHLLLGLLHTGEGGAADALTGAGVSLEDLREQVVRIVGPSEGVTEAPATIPFTPRAKKVLELSLRESMDLGDPSITGGHILLALMREGSGVAAQALMQLGIDLPALRRQVLGTLSAGEAMTEPRQQRRGLFRRSPASRPVSERDLIAHVPVLERLDDASWDALTKARESARMRSAVALEPIDLIAGVAAVTGPGADVLRAAGVELDALNAAVRAVSGGQDPAPPALAFTVEVMRALAESAGEASRQGHPAVTTAHLLYALLAHPDEELNSLLDGLGVDSASLRTETTKALASQ